MFVIINDIIEEIHLTTACTVSMILSMILLPIYILLLLLQMKLIKSLNVLLLHGKGGNGQKMKSQLQPLLEEFDSHSYTFIDAPYTVSRDRIRLNTEKRLIDSNTISHDLAWWLLPDGVRSFEATSYEGVDKSIDFIENIIKSKKIDVVVGHSQGGMIGAIVTARSILGISDVKLKGSILSSPAWPLPFDNLFEDLKKSTKSNGMITIHTIGKADKVNPPAHSLRIAECFKPSTSVHLVEHDGGHILPLCRTSFSTYSKLL